MRSKAKKDWYLELAKGPRLSLQQSLNYLFMHEERKDRLRLYDKHGEAAVTLVILLKCILKEAPQVANSPAWVAFIASKGTSTKVLDILDDMEATL